MSCFGHASTAYKIPVGFKDSHREGYRSINSHKTGADAALRFKSRRSTPPLFRLLRQNFMRQYDKYVRRFHFLSFIGYNATHLLFHILYHFDSTFAINLFLISENAIY